MNVRKGTTRPRLKTSVASQISVRLQSVRFTLFHFQHALVRRVVLQASDTIRQDVPIEISFFGHFKVLSRLYFFLTFIFLGSSRSYHCLHFLLTFSSFFAYFFILHFLVLSMTYVLFLYLFF
jgi:hypothetical protein